MIKLFRNIRKKLASENKFMAYSRYAIGEIILVVIGILIALQINNWNENRKAGLQEQLLLQNLQGEFEDNLKDLDSIAIEVDQVITSLERVFDMFSQPHTNHSSDSLNIWLSDALKSPNWKPSAYLLNNLSNSGSIADLKNERLKLLLYKWSRQQNEMTEVQQRTEKTGEEIISYLKKNGSLRNVDTSKEDFFNYRQSTIIISNAHLLSDPKFENHIDDKLFMYKLTSTWLLQARTTIIQLIEETETNK